MTCNSFTIPDKLTPYTAMFFSEPDISGVIYLECLVLSTLWKRTDLLYKTV